MIKPIQKWEKFWRLTILWESIKRWKELFEKCICDCWEIKFVSRSHLRRWAVRSCWCLSKELTKERLDKYRKKHWMYNTHIYKIYRWAKYRCSNKNATSYKIYWWRWIRFLWDSFEEFYEDMWDSYKEHIKKYWIKNTTIDRINCNWDYCKENCRRVTRQEQNDNRRSNINISYNWIDYPSIAALARAFWKPVYLVRERIRYGRSLDEAIGL